VSVRIRWGFHRTTEKPSSLRESKASMSSGASPTTRLRPCRALLTSERGHNALLVSSAATHSRPPSIRPDASHRNAHAVLVLDEVVLRGVIARPTLAAVSAPNPPAVSARRAGAGRFPQPTPAARSQVPAQTGNPLRDRWRVLDCLVPSTRPSYQTTRSPGGSSTPRRRGQWRWRMPVTNERSILTMPREAGYALLDGHGC